MFGKAKRDFLFIAVFNQTFTFRAEIEKLIFTSNVEVQINLHNLLVKTVFALDLLIVYAGNSKLQCGP